MGEQTHESIYTEWAHSPSHLFEPNGAYFVTARTLHKRHYFDSPQDRTLVLSTLLEQGAKFGWSFQAWAVFSNHYHFVAHAPEDARSLKRMLQAVHSITARHINLKDGAAGRQVWFQYRDTCLTHVKSYFARLHYVHANPVKHGVVPCAEQYPWCSMAWFLREADSGFRRTVLSFKWDRLVIDDDF